MGVFYVDCLVVNIQKRTRKAIVKKLLVDSGSEHTWIPAPILKQVGVQIAKKAMPFVMANGGIITRPVGYAILRAAGFETVDEVVFGEPGDLALLGSRTLEGFGAVVDARKKRLVASGPQPAAASYDAEDLRWANSPEFWKLIEERPRSGRSIPLAEVKARIAKRQRRAGSKK